MSWRTVLQTACILVSRIYVVFGFGSREQAPCMVPLTRRPWEARGQQNGFATEPGSVTAGWERAVRLGVSHLQVPSVWLLQRNVRGICAVRGTLVARAMSTKAKLETREHSKQGEILDSGFPGRVDQVCIGNFQKMLLENG